MRASLFSFALLGFVVICVLGCRQARKQGSQLRRTEWLERSSHEDRAVVCV